MQQVLKTSRVLTVCAALAFALPSTALAQEGGEYAGEVAGFAGFQRWPWGTKGTVGGAIGKAVGRNSLLAFETSYTPLVTGANIVNLTGVVNIGFSTANEKLVPYLSLLGGIGRASGGGASDIDPTFGAGFGVRYYVGSNWGVSPEFRWQRYQSESSINSYVFRAGVFYRFGSR